MMCWAIVPNAPMQVAKENEAKKKLSLVFDHKCKVQWDLLREHGCMLQVLHYKVLPDGLVCPHLQTPLLSFAVQHELTGLISRVVQCKVS
jgi:hypothetical protein